MITEDYVSFEVAKLMKEKGFKERTNMPYVDDYQRLVCYIPTLQMAMKWLREEHNLHFLLSPYNRDSNPLVVYYNIDVVKPPEFAESFYSNIGKDLLYEEACEEAIRYCLENLI